MKRVLITGLSTFWGGRLAQVLERDDSVEAIIGVSPHWSVAIGSRKRMRNLAGR